MLLLKDSGITNEDKNDKRVLTYIRYVAINALNRNRRHGNLKLFYVHSSQRCDEIISAKIFSFYLYQ